MGKVDLKVHIPQLIIYHKNLMVTLQTNHTYNLATKRNLSMIVQKQYRYLWPSNGIKDLKHLIYCFLHGHDKFADLSTGLESLTVLQSPHTAIHAKKEPRFYHHHLASTILDAISKEKLQCLLNTTCRLKPWLPSSITRAGKLLMLKCLCTQECCHTV